MAEKTMEHTVSHVEKDPLLEVESLWKKYQKPVFAVAGVVIVVVGGWFGYTKLVVEPTEEKAADALYKVQEYFAKDSSRKVIDGDGTVKGALSIISKFSGTKAANLAHYYAGISYLKLGEYSKAVDQLKDFSTNAKQVAIVANGALGDAYSELGKKDEAVEQYKKASSVFEKDEALSAEYLFRAAALTETMGKNKEALELYKSVKERFPTSDKAKLADKYIYRLNVEENDLSINK